MKLETATVFFVFCCSIFAGCTIADLVNTGNLEVSAYMPNTDMVDLTNLESASITFVREPNHTSAEEAFSLMADGIILHGEFTWRGHTMFFQPFAAWKNGTYYRMKVSAALEDYQGNSLSREFIHYFTTKKEEIRPAVRNTTPGDGSLTTTILPLITIQFTEPMDPGSVADAFQISPNTGGYLTWDVAMETFSYNLIEKLDWQTEYRITITDRATDTQSNSLSENWTGKFFTGTDSNSPKLLSLTSTEPNSTATPDDLRDDVFSITSNWESNWPMILTFSEAMDTDSLRGNIVIWPSVPWQEEWNNAGTILTLSPKSDMEWAQTYALHIRPDLTDIQGNSLDDDYRFNIHVNGSGSRPPEVVAIVFYPDSADPNSATVISPYAAQSLAGFSPPPGDITTGNAVIDVFLTLADGARPDLLSLIENFHVKRGGVNDFTPLGAAMEDATFNPPNIGTGAYGPVPPGVPYSHWVRFIVYIDNDDTLATGILTFIIDGEFADSLGRKMDEDFEIPIVITD